MNILHDIYNSLLADVGLYSGFSEIRESGFDLQWGLHEAPKLEKKLLAAIECGRKPTLDEWPAALQRLAARSFEDPVLLRYLRQLLLFCYKAEVDYDNAQVQSAFALFEQTNLEVQSFGESLSRQSPPLLGLVRKMCQSVLYKVKFRNIIPKHGPGASTTPKHRWTRLFEPIEALYPYSDYFCTQGGTATDGWEELEHTPYITAKLQAVPKDSRGPRLICVHPAEAIWIQQGIRLELERAISLDRVGGCWPRGHISFEDQTVNGQIALLSSKSGAYATLDLKEASDRISDVLVQILFGRYYKYFGSCRAQKYKIPGFDPKDLHCYAPMGNATTFPVQSLVFWAICVASLHRQGLSNPNAVFVFGDDLIVPSKCAEGVIHDLETFGLLANKEKSFWRGTFRESCGVDAFKGVNVTPIRWKMRTMPDNLESLQSLSDLAMRLRIAGYEYAACTSYRHLRDLMWVQQNRKCVFFTNNRNHGSIAEFSEMTSQMFQNAFWHKKYQRFVSPVYRLKEDPVKPDAHGWNHVLESICSLEHTRRSNVPSRLAPRRVRLKRGWTDLG